ncbi:Thymidylate kinase [Candidatus Hydrogenisulfobacillus filiaventi]|uniref:Thymidylate kinase n=1 Tax=Candidatus Hydrogenisulfobacillus filiaventi TaxID=2707344 RepID=A0A6F8ZK77_9FIRM|nr:Thymidylate kinase [Candidatus Hydrogenisulfobacillus filiaventi]
MGAAVGGRGLFISFEGLDGVGKSTQAAALAAWLGWRWGREVVMVREPGGTPLGEAVRRLLLDAGGAAPASVRAEALLFAAARAELVERVVRPALARGAVVVADRFADSTVAYQGYGLGLGPRVTAAINAWATGGLEPHLTIWLDGPPLGPLSGDRIEQRGEDFRERVRAGYAALAAADPRRWRRVEADRPLEQVTAQVQGLVERLLAGKGAEA